MSKPSDKQKFDPIKLFTQALSYIKHIRLMLLMLAFGILTGIVAYLFTIPTYRSTAAVSVQNYGAALVNRDVAETSQRSVFDRSFLNRIRSSRVQLATAKRMGLVNEDATSEEVLEIISGMVVTPVDLRNLEITIQAYDPVVVRNFVEELVNTYEELQRESYEEYRDEALRRYAEQLTLLEAEISETISSLTSLERDQNLTEVTLEQQSLLEIPKQLIQTRERLARMKDVKSLLTSLETQARASGGLSARSGPGGNINNMISLLSLLGSFEEDTEVMVGNVTSSTGFKSSVRAMGGKIDIGQVVAPADVESIEPWREIEKERRLILSQIKQKSETYMPGHRVMRDLRTRLGATEEALETEFKMLRQKFDLQYASLEEKKTRLEERLPEYHAVTEELGRSSQAYSNITSQQLMWDQAREKLSEKLATITFAEDFDWIDLSYKGLISIRDEVPVSPNKTKVALIALILGLAGAFGVPTVLNMVDTSASTVAQLEGFTGLTGIGIVPLTPKDLLEDVARSPAQGATVPNYLLECFRVIRSGVVMHPNRNGKSQVVMVTSARPQEGKTTQATNLAWAFHSMGEKTLLLDCDLRRGRVHGVIKHTNSPGMTRLLLGECSPEDAIQEVGLNGFDAIPRGPVIAGTTDLLCQDVFKKLLESFRGRYDRIVIDAPPVLGLSESTSLQQFVDGTVLVVRAEATGRKDVMDAISMLSKSNAHFFGFVLNAVDLSKLGNYYNYYYYSAPYYDHVEAEEEPARVSPKNADGKLFEPFEL